MPFWDLFLYGKLVNTSPCVPGCARTYLNGLICGHIDFVELALLGVRGVLGSGGDTSPGILGSPRRFTSGLLPNDTFAARMSAGGMMSAGFSRLRAGMRGVEIERDRDSTGKDDVRGGLRMPALIN